MKSASDWLQCFTESELNQLIVVCCKPSSAIWYNLTLWVTSQSPACTCD